MRQKVSVAIIGAGSAGLSALRQVRRYTDSFVMINDGPLGTKCARVGCMPSKAIIQIARDYHRRHVLPSEGILGGDSLRADIPAVMRHVRSLRDQFADGMASTTEELAGDKLITGKAEITSPNSLRVGKIEIESEKIIIATGAPPKVPDAWKSLGNRILTSETIFEQDDLPGRIAVIGLGPIGLELGQSLSRLGIEVTGFDRGEFLGTITDPDVNAAAVRILRREFPIHLRAGVDLQDDGHSLTVKHPELEVTVDSVIVATGIRPAVQGLGLENLGVRLDESGVPPFDPNTMQIGDLPVFIAGDVNGCRPILHEALDEGFIAGSNSSSGKIERYCRRSPLALTFCDPEIAVVGQAHEQLALSKRPFVIGKVDFSQQSRAMLEARDRGLLHVYIDDETGEILGAELVCSGGEHLAQQLALAIQQRMSLLDVLQMPFYHPTIEEALRTALQDATKQLSSEYRSRALSLCGSCPESPLC